MKPRTWTRLVAGYRALLAAYVDCQDETHLARGYEFGRKALNLGLGVMDVARLHQEAMVKVAAAQCAHCEANLLGAVRRRTPGEDPAQLTARRAKAAETFFMEVLTSFEVAHRGFRDACDRLQRMNATLAARAAEMAETNQRLAREITERKNAQTALQESEQKYRSVIESAQDGIITIDERGRLVAMNAGAEAMFGYKREELLGRSVKRLIPRPLRPAAELTLRCIASGAEPQLFERPIESVGLHRRGGEFSVELTLASWRTRAGIFFTGIVRDIRARKQAELALRESREHYIQLFKEARAMEESLRQLSNKVLTAQEEERKHISRELHDEIGQALTAVNVSIAMLRAHAEGDAVFAKKVESAQRLLEQSMDMVHRFARELRPSMLDHLGAYAALRNYVKGFSERTGIRVDLQSTVDLGNLDNEQGTVLYRVAQESLTNVFKHAQATRVRIRLQPLPDGVGMEISDNGRGTLATEKINGRNGRLGLLGMEERVRLVNGKFEIQSVPKRGTTVRVQIPVTPQARGEVAPPPLHVPARTPALSAAF